MTEPPPPRRPGRPSGRRLLSIEQIVATAIDLLDLHGPTGLSIRRVGEALGVHSNAVYTYVADRAALEAAIVEQLMREADPSLLRGPKRSWRRRLTDYATSLRCVLRTHPGAMGFFMTAPLSGDVALEVGESMQRCFVDAGLHPADASRASYIAGVYVFGYLAFDIAETDGVPPLPDDDERARLRLASLEHVDPEQHPLTMASRGTAARWVSEATFEWGLQRTIDGLVGHRRTGP